VSEKFFFHVNVSVIWAGLLTLSDSKSDVILSHYFSFIHTKFFENIFQHQLTFFYFPKFFSLADGADEGGMFPLTALLLGALLTIGVAGFLIVILALKKNREQSQPHENGLKDKHIGLNL
jgi:hypothetical protein